MKIPVARPIEDVVKDLEARILGTLPGRRPAVAAWSAFCQARELLEMAKAAIDRDDREQNETKKRALEYYVWIKHGEYYAACRIIHSLADAFKVDSVTWIEVDDGSRAEAVGAAEASPA